ncbi:hypothetical protein ADUPG1_012005 [Aduncisulcus paluster]|uniref:AAA+ ATPase domain-containing protein n=1 Tax=Aduncisulcus paluster TaxID=2918883 RepID=A0ABQ5JXW3_9EUKA|nr:hypothetical protein ADUPG1_012005 [Aduncisulcus paluster]
MEDIVSDSIDNLYSVSLSLSRQFPPISFKKKILSDPDAIFTLTSKLEDIKSVLYVLRSHSKTSECFSQSFDQTPGSDGFSYIIDSLISACEIALSNARFRVISSSSRIDKISSMKPHFSVSSKYISSTNALSPKIKALDHGRIHSVMSLDPPNPIDTSDPKHSLPPHYITLAKSIGMEYCPKYDTFCPSESKYPWLYASDEDTLSSRIDHEDSPIIGMSGPLKMLERILLQKGYKSRPALESFFPLSTIASSPVALLYGPPGCGKTLAAQVLCKQHNIALIHVSPSLLLSKWVGESEKNISALFYIASHCACECVVLFDEIDVLVGARAGTSGTSGMHDSSSNATGAGSGGLLGQILIEMNHYCSSEAVKRDQKARSIMKHSLSAISSNSTITPFSPSNKSTIPYPSDHTHYFQLSKLHRNNSLPPIPHIPCMLMCTNIPKALDPALLRRMSSRIFIGLPDYKGRVQCIKRALGKWSMVEDVSVFLNSHHSYSKKSIHYPDILPSSQSRRSLQWHSNLSASRDLSPSCCGAHYGALQDIHWQKPEQTIAEHQSRLAEHQSRLAEHQSRLAEHQSRLREDIDDALPYGTSPTTSTLLEVERENLHMNLEDWFILCSKNRLCWKCLNNLDLSSFAQFHGKRRTSLSSTDSRYSTNLSETKEESIHNNLINSLCPACVSSTVYHKPSKLPKDNLTISPINTKRDVIEESDADSTTSSLPPSPCSGLPCDSIDKHLDEHSEQPYERAITQKSEQISKFIPEKQILNVHLVDILGLFSSFFSFSDIMQCCAQIIHSCAEEIERRYQDSSSCDECFSDHLKISSLDRHEWAKVSINTMILFRPVGDGGIQYL